MTPFSTDNRFSADGLILCLIIIHRHGLSNGLKQHGLTNDDQMSSFAAFFERFWCFATKALNT